MHNPMDAFGVLFASYVGAFSKSLFQAMLPALCPVMATPSHW